MSEISPVVVAFMWILMAPVFMVMLLVVLAVGAGVLLSIARFVAWGVRSPRRH